MGEEIKLTHRDKLIYKKLIIEANQISIYFNLYAQNSDKVYHIELLCDEFTSESIVIRHLYGVNSETNETKKFRSNSNLFKFIVSIVSCEIKDMKDNYFSMYKTDSIFEY